MKEILNRIKCLGIWVLVFLLYYKGLPIILAGLFGNLYKSSNMFVSNLSLILSEIIIFIILVYIYRKKIIKDVKNYKDNYKKNLDTGFKYYALGLLVMIASNLILSFIFKDMATNEAVNREYLSKYPLYSIVAMIFVGPLVEEIVFRLGFRDAFKKWLPYCLFSAFVFGGLHVLTAYETLTINAILSNWHQLLYIIPYGALGFAFAKTYFETDNICTSMTIHMLHNAFTVLLIFCIM